MPKAQQEKDTMIASTPYNVNTRETHLVQEKINSAYNHDVIIQALKDGRARDLSDEPKVPKGTPAIIVGSGPSLDVAIPLLKDWKGGLLTSTSQARTLAYHGAKVTHIVALDPFSHWEEVRGIDWAAMGTKLVTHPGVWPCLVKNWPGEILLFRQFLGNKASWYAQDQNLMYSARDPDTALECQGKAPKFENLIHTEMTVFACAPPSQLFAGQALGYGTMFASGIDFAFHSGLRRFTMQIPQEDGTWKESVSKGDKDALDKWMEKREIKHKKYLQEHNIHTDAERTEDLMETTNGLVSERLMMYYKKNFLTSVRLSGQTCYICGLGAITELPQADIANVIKTQGKGYARFTKAQLAKWLEPYLAQVGCFVLSGPAGETFIESENPLQDAPGYMRTMFRTYRCKACGLVGQAKDDADHTGENCPRCPHGTWAHVNKINLKANVKRLERLVRGMVKPIEILVDPNLSISPGAIMDNVDL